MARVPKELFAEFQSHLNKEQELREVSTIHSKKIMHFFNGKNLRLEKNIKTY